MSQMNALYEMARGEAFDPVGSFYEGKRARQSDQIMQNKLAELGRADAARPFMGKALGGDQNALAQLGQIDPQGFMDVSKFQSDQTRDAASARKANQEALQKEIESVVGVFEQAKTPEDWARAVSFLEGKGHKISPTDRDFANRDLVLAQANQEAADLGLNPIYGVDASGNTVAFQASKSGSPKQMQFPAGIRITPGVKTVDTGTGTLLIDSRTGQPMQGGGGAPGGIVPKDVAGEAEAKEAGKTEAEIAAKRPLAELTLKSTTGALNRMATAARELRSHRGLGGITGLSSVFPNMPGGAAANAQAKLTTLKSQIGFSVLQAMRDASKTGGALGNVSDQEGVRLENNLAALDQAQSLEELQNALDQIIAYAEESGGNLKAAFDQTYNITATPLDDGGTSGATPDWVAPFAEQGAKQAPDGNWYIPDPDRPGKFIMLEPDNPQ